jgi:hypothetical protein
MCRLSRNLRASTFWNPMGLSRPVMGLLYLYWNTDASSHSCPHATDGTWRSTQGTSTKQRRAYDGFHLVCPRFRDGNFYFPNFKKKSVTISININMSMVQLSIQLRVQQDPHGFVCILYFTISALHVSSATYTHHQEHKQQSTAVRIRDCYGMWEAG